MKINLKVSIQVIAFFTILNFAAQATEGSTGTSSEDLHARILRKVLDIGITSEMLKSMRENEQRKEKSNQEKEQKKELEEVRNFK